MKRVYAALASAAILLALLPSAVSADRVTKFTDQFVSVSCEAEFDGGFATVFTGTSSEFGDFAEAFVWLDPALPFEDESTFSGFTEVVTATDDGTTVEIQTTIPLFDAEGNEVGDAALSATAARTGDVNVIGPDTGKTNYNSKTTGFEEFIDGSGTLEIPGFDVSEGNCSGGVGEVSFFSTNPRAFVTANSGVGINCEWETETGQVFFFAGEDGFGFFADLLVFTTEGDDELFTTQSSGSVGLAGMEVSLDLIDSEGDPQSATARATFTLVGSPVKSTQLGASFQIKRTDQALDPTGSLDLSTGESFPIDDEQCNALQYSTHSTGTTQTAMKRGPAPVNDVPEGAIALKLGSRLNAMNAGAANEPEVPILTCPEGFGDQFGRTLWYTINGTGGPVTIDTAGSNIDTLIGVYAPTDEGFEEIACIDDVEFDPVGSTYQAALTIDTEEGVTYYVQIGGFRFPFDEAAIPETGRIRISVR